MADDHRLEHDGRYVLPADVDEIWARVSDVERFPDWWPWLEDFRVEGDGIVTGSVLRGAVCPPLPYDLAVAVHLDEVVEAERVLAHLRGDLAGDAQLHLDDHADGCEVTIRWSVEVTRPGLRLATQMARPAAEWGHDRVVSATVRSFEQVLGRPVTASGDAEPVG
jgi:carbon monoxide dehydrogenase subunit G